MEQILDAFLPHAPEILETMVIPFIIWAAVKGARKFGVDINARHQETLKSAFRTGARLALAKQLTGAAAVKVILDHVQGDGAGDAVRHFKLDTDKLFDLGKAALEHVRKDDEVDALAVAMKKAIR